MKKGEKSQAWPLVIAPAWGSNSNNGSRQCAIHQLLPSNSPLTAIERWHAWDHSKKRCLCPSQHLVTTFSYHTEMRRPPPNWTLLAGGTSATHLNLHCMYCNLGGSRHLHSDPGHWSSCVSLPRLLLWGNVLQRKPGDKGAKMSHCWSGRNLEARGHLRF